jgi:hypothetical protein
MTEDRTDDRDGRFRSQARLEVGWRGTVRLSSEPAGEPTPVEIADLGTGGASLRGSARGWKVGSRLLLTIFHPQAERGEIEVAGVVRWVEPPSGGEEPAKMGVELVELGAEKGARLLEWLSEIPRVREI